MFDALTTVFLSFEALTTVALGKLTGSSVTQEETKRTNKKTFPTVFSLYYLSHCDGAMTLVASVITCCLVTNFILSAYFFKTNYDVHDKKNLIHNYTFKL